MLSSEAFAPCDPLEPGQRDQKSNRHSHRASPRAIAIFPRPFPTQATATWLHHEPGPLIPLARTAPPSAVTPPLSVSSLGGQQMPLEVKEMSPPQPLGEVSQRSTDNQIQGWLPHSLLTCSSWFKFMSQGYKRSQTMSSTLRARFMLLTTSPNWK